MPHSVTVTFKDASHLRTVEGIFTNACPNKSTDMACGGDSIGVSVTGLSDSEVESIKSQVAGINAIVDEHSKTFTVLTRELAAH